ncbi:gluconate kinase, SKI family [Rhizobium sp. RU33A]|uniref:gluconokinase n=1 Tax=Rhizobium sp. RU33A TaxID=1907413 RepID=UPI00095667FD|nr:gluconokinase [Rhizobium sp. RU33A]SIR10428.1 gluconate kinase, SKI family [Rhizobium sp. RU33A]
MILRLVIMGVAGCGKSTVGAALSEQLQIPYEDGDDLHSADAVEKMRAGIPLGDDDRWPWLDRIAHALRSEVPLIIGCSALRRSYRDRIRAGAGGDVTFVHLAGDRDLIASRMASRAGHYMPLSLLDSQFATLERPGPDEAIEVTIDQPMDAIVGQVLSHLGGNPQ